MFEDDKYTLTDSEGNVVVEIDIRTVSKVAAQKIDEIKTLCQKDIEATGIGWMVERQISGGKEVPEEIKIQCAEYRERSKVLEQQVLDFVSNATNESDHGTCDNIQNISWTEIP
jgi:hypothetical protein